MGTINYKVTGVPYLVLSRGDAVSITGTLTETALRTVTIPDGALGANGSLRISSMWSWVNTTVNNKLPRIRLGGISGTAFWAPTFTNAFTANQNVTTISNRNSASSQIAYSASVFNTIYTPGNAALTTGVINTAVAQDLVITGQLADITDTLTLERITVEILYSA